MTEPRGRGDGDGGAGQPDGVDAVEDVVAALWRDQWGRLLALLVAQLRRLDVAEDALATAFGRAAERWPLDGVPANPPAWLLVVARRAATDALRRESTRVRALPLLVVEARVQERAAADDLDDAAGRADEHVSLDDDELRLVFLCCHPALAPASQVALALRLVLGVSTRDVARLFLVPEPTMAARLTRARRKIATSGIPLRLPDPADLDERLEVVVQVAYLAFTAGYAPGSGAEVLRADVAGEALRLARLVDRLAPGRVVVRALLALLVLQHARRDARVSDDGALVLLPDQDRSRWRHGEIATGLALAAGLPPGDGLAEELRLQAMVAGLHASAPRIEDTDWPVVAGLYAALERRTGSAVVRLNRAVAVAEASGPEAGLALLDGLDDALPRSHRLPAVRAELLVRAGRPAEALPAYDLALERCDNDAERAHLRGRRAALSPGGRPCAAPPAPPA